MAYKDEKVRRAIFSHQVGIQFVTLFSLVIAIILFGIIDILEGKELAALLGGLSGYILGRSTGGSAKEEEGVVPQDNLQLPPQTSRTHNPEHRRRNQCIEFQLFKEREIASQKGSFAGMAVCCVLPPCISPALRTWRQRVWRQPWPCFSCQARRSSAADLKVASVQASVDGHLCRRELRKQPFGLT